MTAHDDTLEILDRQDLTAAEAATVVTAAAQAGARFGWYADLLQRAGFDARPELSRVPILRETDLAATYYSTDRPQPDGGRTFVTSGTTGTRKPVDWPPLDHARYVEHRAAYFRTIAGARLVTACADLGTGHAAASALEIFARAGLRGSQLDVSSPIDQHVDLLRSTRPDLLYTMPMILERIVAAGGPGYIPGLIVVVGDLAPSEWREAMAIRIGMDPGQIHDVFGSIEVGAIAYSNEATGGYRFHEHILPEIIPAPRPDHPGAGLLVLTSLERDGFPAVRYAAGDVIDGLRRIDSAGQGGWGYRRHLGREGSALKHGEMLDIDAIAVAIAAAAPGVAWGVRRNGLEVVIELERGAYSEEMAGAIRAAVRAAHPAVDQMIASGLVGEIGVEPAALAHSSGAKRVIGELADDGRAAPHD
jgi:phenylacetate-coenzyme A ligase PaaK-like adenylate-forming protein